MPRTKLDKHTKPKGAEFVELIWGRMAAEEISVEELAGKVGISKDILYARKRNPENFKLCELTKICRNLNIPIEKTRECFKY